MNSSRGSIRVLLSSGIGRLHFVESARALAGAGAQVRLLTGWIPSPRLRPLVNFLGIFFARKGLYERLAIRRIDDNPAIRCVGLPLHEGLAQIAFLLGKKGLVPLGPGQRATWRLFGQASVPHLHGVDLVHIRSGAGAGLIEAAKARGIPVIVDHSIAHPAYIEEVLAAGMPPSREVAEISAKDPFWRQVLADCRAADLLLVNSDFVARTFTERGFDAAGIRTAYLGVRPDFLGLKTDSGARGPLRILFTGAFGRRKGADVFVEVLQRLERKGQPFVADILGDASESGHLLAPYVAAGKAVLHGSVPQQALKEFLRLADVYLFPTRAEGCAKSAMEAMAAGVPVVTTDACGLPGEAGKHFLSVPVAEPQALEYAVSRLAVDPDLRREIGRAGSALVAEWYQWHNYGRTVLQIYHDLISDRSLISNDN
jgi:glycosyltransferase involved in cell wall biosynthesis